MKLICRITGSLLINQLAERISYKKRIFYDPLDFEIWYICVATRYHFNSSSIYLWLHHLQQQKNILRKIRSAFLFKKDTGRLIFGLALELSGTIFNAIF